MFVLRRYCAQGHLRECSQSKPETQEEGRTCCDLVRSHPVIHLCHSANASRDFGGGFTLDNRADVGSPNGLIQVSQANGDGRIVYVAMYYRLGAMGWLAGLSLQAAGGVSNAGLYDQRLAIQWVKKHIHRRGGDPEQITVLGEPSGG